MELKEIKLEIWKIQEHIQRVIQTFERETGLFVEDIFLIREDTVTNTGRLDGVNMKVVVEGSTFLLSRRLGKLE